MGRRDRKQRKQDKRASKALEKAARRGDTLAFLERRDHASADTAVALDLLLRDAEASGRNGDHIRATRLASAIATWPELLELLSGRASMVVASCGWVVLGASLRTSQWDLASRLMPAFEAALREHAPELLAWLRSYLDQRGELSEAMVDTLPPLAMDGVTRRVTPASELVPGELEGALLTADVDRLGELVFVLADQPPERRADLGALAVRLAWRHALRAVASGRSPAALAVLATLGENFELDADLLLTGVRLARQHLRASEPRDLRVLGRLLVLASAHESSRSIVPLVLEGIPIATEPGARRDAVELGRRLLEGAPNPAIWLWTIRQQSANFDFDIDAPNAPAPPPHWLLDAGEELVDGGELPRLAGELSRPEFLGLLDAIACLRWETGLRFVSQVLGVAPADVHGDLAAFARECLTICESPDRLTVADLLASFGGGRVQFTGEFGRLIAALRQMPQDLEVPPELFGFGSNDLGPHRREFIERHAAQLLPYSRDLLLDVLLDDKLHERALEFVGLHLGDQPPPTKLVEVIILGLENGWAEIEAHARARLLENHGDDAGALAWAFAELVEIGVTRVTLRPIALALFEAIECGASTEAIPADLLIHAKSVIGRRKKAKKKATKKKATKKKKKAKKKATKKAANQKAQQLNIPLEGEA